MPALADRNVVFIVGDTTVKVGGHYAGTAVTRLQDVDKAMAALKKTGEIESPVRCLWQPKE